MTRKYDGDEAKTKTYFQMSRFVQMNGEWFYTTREGEERGPFESKAEAEGDFIECIRHLAQMEEYGVDT